MSKQQYLDFDLLIERASQGYRARVLDSPAGETTAEFLLPFRDADVSTFPHIDNRWLRHIQPGPTPSTPPVVLTPQHFGAQLYDAVFAGTVGSLFQRSLDRAKAQDAGLRIRLRLDANAPELAELPWEYLYARPLNRFLVLSDDTVLVRYIELAQPAQPLRTEPPLHVLAVVANPNDAPPLAVEREWQHLETTLRPLQAAGQFHLDRLSHPTVAQLLTRLRQDDVHILHFIGHGYFDAAAQQGGLVFEDAQGHSDRVDAGRLATLLGDRDRLALIFLNACDGARSGHSDFFAGTAQRLVQQGVPAVLAMQFPVSDAAALTLAQEFYGALAAGLAVDAAVASARKAVAVLENEQEWATPVLFSRAPDNRLFAAPAPQSTLKSSRRRWSRILLAVLAALVILVASGVYALRYTAAPAPIHCLDDRQCVLVADFAPPDDELALEVTRKIRSALQDEDLLPRATFNVQPVGIVNDVEAARRLADQEGALIIVWGQLFDRLQELNINFELTDQFGIGASRQVRPYRVHFFDTVTQKLLCAEECYKDIATVRAVLERVSTVIAYTAAGMLHYASDQPEAADRDFSTALACSGQPTDFQPGQTSITQTLPITLLLDLPECRAGEPIPGFEPASIYYYAGKSKLLTGDYRTAIDYLQQAAAQNQSDPAAWIGIATAYQSWLNQPGAEQSLHALGQARMRTNNLRAGLRGRQRAAADYELGLIAELMGDLETARGKYAEAVDGFGGNDPDAYVAMIALGRLHQQTGHSEDAVATLWRAIGLDKDAPWAYLQLAQVYAGERTKAENQLELARQSAPSEAYVDITWAELCDKHWQDFACAAATYAHALEKRPNSGWLYSRVGDFYRTHQQWQQAADLLKIAVELRPHDPWAHERLAFVLHSLGEFKQAATEYQRTIDLLYDANLATDLYCNLGRAQQLDQQLETARLSIQRCADLAQTDEQQRRANRLLAELERP